MTADHDPPYELTIPKCRETACAGSLNKPVVLGIRPDHIACEGASSPSSVRMTVRDVEPLGPHTLVIGSVGGFSFTAQMSVGVKARPNQCFAVPLDLEKAHLFDKATGEIIPA
jgi:multiple sugar transport system ATP-binding protein